VGVGPPSVYHPRTVGFEIRTAADDAESGAAVTALAFHPLPRVAAHVITSERRTPLPIGPDAGRVLRVRTVVTNAGLHFVAPRIFQCGGTLSRVLPLFLRQQPFGGPTGICAGIAQVHVDDRMVFLLFRDSAVSPVFEEVVGVSGLVARRAEEFFKLFVGHRRDVHGIGRKSDLAAMGRLIGSAFAGSKGDRNLDLAPFDHHHPLRKARRSVKTSSFNGLQRFGASRKLGACLASPVHLRLLVEETAESPVGLRGCQKGTDPSRLDLPFQHNTLIRRSHPQFDSPDEAK